MFTIGFISQDLLPHDQISNLMLGKLSVSLTLTLEEIAGQGWLKCSLMGKPGEDTAWKLSLLCVCGSWSQGSGARERESLVFYPSPGRREETFQRMLRGLVMDWMWKLVSCPKTWVNIQAGEVE